MAQIHRSFYFQRMWSWPVKKVEPTPPEPEEITLSPSVLHFTAEGQIKNSLNNGKSNSNRQRLVDRHHSQ